MKEPLSATNVETPSAGIAFLFASVMGVLWAIILTAMWALLAFAFGSSRGNVRLMTVLVIGAVVVVFLCNHSYRQGWKSRRRR